MSSELKLGRQLLVSLSLWFKYYIRNMKTRKNPPAYVIY